MTEWGRNWIRLYRHPSPSWLALPHSTRGLGYEMLRVCDESGKIECKGLDPFDVVALACSIQGHGRRLAERDFARLGADGFFRLEGTTLVIPNYREAQSALSPAAAKKAEQRARTPSREAPPKGTDSDPTGTKVTSAGTESAPSGTDLVPTGTNSAHQTANPADSLDRKGDSPSTRPEETRPEETRPPPFPPPRPSNEVAPVRQRKGSDELIDILSRSSGGACSVLVGTNSEAMRSVGAVADQIESQGRDSAADFATLGEAFKAGIIQKRLQSPPSLLALLGKPQADGTRPATALVTAIDFAIRWKQDEEKKRAELEASRKPSVPQELSDCEKRELQSQATLALAHLAKLKAEADLSKPTKAPVRPAGAGPMFGMGVRTNPPPPVDSRPPTETN